MLRLVVAPKGIEDCPTVLLTCGGSITVSVSEDEVLLPAAVELRVTVFEYVSSTAADTLTVTVQVPGAREAVEKLRVLAPADGLNVLPVQVFVTPGELATSRAPG